MSGKKRNAFKAKYANNNESMQQVILRAIDEYIQSDRQNNISSSY